MKKMTLVTLIMLLTSGCGEFAYKRGASAKDFDTAKKTCQNAGGDSAAVEKCLDDNGWFVQKLDAIGMPDTELFATTSVTPNNEQTISKNTDKSSSSTLNEDQKANEITPPAPVNNLETYKITSWWKMGAGQPALDADIKACSDELGEEHKPSLISQTYTRGFAICMRQKGWRGLKEK